MLASLFGRTNLPPEHTSRAEALIGVTVLKRDDQSLPSYAAWCFTMLLVGCVMTIRSEPRMCKEGNLKPAYWVEAATKVWLVATLLVSY